MFKKFITLALWGFLSQLHLAHAFDGAYLIVDLENDKLIVAQNEKEQLSIASITKLMTAVVVLRDGLDLEERIPIQAAHTSNHLVRGSLSPGLFLSRRQLLMLALVSSDNRAAYSLAAAYPGGVRNFVQRMNEIAKELQMFDSEFVDPTGIMAYNRSTAIDLVKLLQESTKYDIISHTAQTVRGAFSYKNNKSRTQTVIYNTTNYFSAVLDLHAAKTGFTRAAGRCLSMVFDVAHRRYALVVLGAPTAQDRTSLVKILLSAVPN